MSESQFEKLLKAARDKEEKDAEIKRLRELLKRCEPYIHEAFCGVPSRIELIEEIRKEVGDE